MSSEILAYKCPQCGASIPFDAHAGDFSCIYCGGHFTKEQLDTPIEGNTEEKLPPDMPEEERQLYPDSSRLYMCPTCGASVVTDSELDASAECYYCHSPVVLSGRLSGEYRPDKLIPFKKTKEDAINGFEEWTKGRKAFLAKGFGSRESLEKIQGIYIPFWLADCCVDGNLSAECYKNISSHRSGDYIITTKQKTLADRKGSVIFNGVPADGSSRADDALMDSIEPFDYNELKDFDMSYLSGHSAIRYDVDQNMVFERINQRVCSTSREIFMESIKGQSSIDPTVSEFRVSSINYKQGMLPMWFLSYKYKGKMFFYAMNGQTGKFGGTLPINKGKIFAVSFLIPAVIAFLLALFLSLGGFLQ